MNHVRYADPRIYEMIRAYKWQEVQRDLLEGRRSWGKAPARGEKRQIDWMLDCLRERGFTFRPSDFAMEIGTVDPLPPVDPFLDRYIDQYGLRDLPVQILSLNFVEECHGIPICRGMIYGSTGGKVGSEPTKQGFQDDVYIVGRLDVRHVLHVHGHHLPDAATEGEHVVAKRFHMRRTLKRARHTAAKVAAHVSAWDRFVAERDILECRRMEEIEDAPGHAQAELDAEAGYFDDLL